MDVKFINQTQRIVDLALKKYLNGHGRLYAAMRYSVFAGGKRFRPLLCLATARALGRANKRVVPFACAVEMLHTFTLIHDDLPAMDNADFRRGKPACHKAFGEDLAILAGDALNTLAFELIADDPMAVKVLSRALIHVVEGQVADIASANKKVSVKELYQIHHLKTAALLIACVEGAASILGASNKHIHHLKQYATHLGLDFQIADDILDVTASQADIGKPARADLKKGFPYLVGLDKAKELAQKERALAIKAVDKFGQQADILRQMAAYVVERKN